MLPLGSPGAVEWFHVILLLWPISPVYISLYATIALCLLQYRWFEVKICWTVFKLKKTLVVCGHIEKVKNSPIIFFPHFLSRYYSIGCALLVFLHYVEKSSSHFGQFTPELQ